MATTTDRPARPLRADAVAQNAKAAKTVAEAVAGRAAIMEPKYDGWRLLVNRADDGVHVYSRSGKSYTGRLPHIEAEIAERFPAGTWLDGEAVCLTIEDDGKVTDAWGEVQGALTKHRAPASVYERVTFMTFDLIAHGDLDARRLPYRERRAALERIFDAGGFTAVTLTAQLDATEENLAALIALGYEGAMVKHIDAPYSSGARGAGWFKLKAQHTVDAVIIGYEDGKDGFAGYVGAVRFAQVDADGNLVERGQTSGMDWRTRDAISRDRAGWIGRVIEVKHFGLMPPTARNPLGALRHPDWVRTRDDKAAHECGIDNGC